MTVIMGRALKVMLVSVGAIVAAALSVAYYAVDPASAEFAPRCVFKAVTGLDCPGCGSQRMFHALLHGDITGAWAYNPFLLLMLPVLALLAYSAATRTRHPRLYARLNSPFMITTLFILLVGWSIMRNIM